MGHVAAARVAHAQQIAPVALTRPAMFVPPDTNDAQAPRPSFPAVAARTGGSVLLGFATALGGYAAWFAFEQRRQCRGLPRGFCGIDTDAAVPVILVAAIPGVALGASAPRFGSPCPFARRLGRGFSGAVTGTVIGAALTLVGESESQLLAAPLAGVLGAVSMVGRCR